jgi:hypothetical protein
MAVLWIPIMVLMKVVDLIKDYLAVVVLGALVGVMNVQSGLVIFLVGVV